ncbi:myeloperoxidase-like [Dreissena polymorpha]|uniref:myeloperoxidase-like n=1 Tax=Dreissena polymorpha TaxID=45954 RepID=UPI00226409FE|nr:myeloperoxidase-like [Dreissena polymorpha]
MYTTSKWNPRRKSVTGTNNEIVLLPGTRNISNAVHATDSDKPLNKESLSDAFFYFMQFITHDVTKTPEGLAKLRVPRFGHVAGREIWRIKSPFCLAVNVEETDDFFSSLGDCFDVHRSFTVLDCNDTSGFRNQINDITAYIDGSMLYGSSGAELNELRSFIAGFLKNSTANLMPEGVGTEDMECDNVEDPALCFLAGDTRANVHPGLTTFHTVFMREHNRVAAYLGELNAAWNDDRIFQETRRIVAAELQHITFNEMLPKVLDSSYVSKYGLSAFYSYNKSVDASVIQEFNFGFRFHNLMPAVLHLAELVGSSVENMATLEQENVFQHPGLLVKDNYRGVDQVLLGIVANGCPFINGLMNDASRNFLFLEENGDSYDLASVNIERGRDWGTPAYYLYRQLCGGVTISVWTDLASTHSADVIADLQIVYASPKDVDLWTGLVTETAVGTSIAGPTMSCLIATQFANLRNGDRFWYETSNADLKFTTVNMYK